METNIMGLYRDNGIVHGGAYQLLRGHRKGASCSERP